MAMPVEMPWPISMRHSDTVTESSAPMVTQPLRRWLPAGPSGGVPATRRWRGGAASQPMPSTPAVPTPASTKRLRVSLLMRHPAQKR